MVYPRKKTTASVSPLVTGEDLGGDDKEGGSYCHFFIRWQMKDDIQIRPPVMRNVYEKKFGWNLSDKDVLLQLYYDMGGTVGLMLYATEHPQDASAIRLAQFLLDQKESS